MPDGSVDNPTINYNTTPTSSTQVNLNDLMGEYASQPQAAMGPGTSVIPTGQAVHPDEMLGTAKLDPTATNATLTTGGPAATAAVQGNQTTSTTNPFLLNGNAATGTGASVSAANQAGSQAVAAQGDVDPRALVQNQFNDLSQTKDVNGNPVWATDALKQTNAGLAARGMSNSSIAAGAQTDAVMKSIIPMAQFNAAEYQQMSLVNLSNQQQTNLANAQQKMQYNLANLTAEQQSNMQNVQNQQASLLSDQSFTNAANQFNAQSENQTKQFFANLATSISQNNATRTDAMSQFNSGQANAVSEFNSNLSDQRERFNVQNQLIVDQSNAQWRRTVNSANTAAINAAQATNAQNALNIQNYALNNLWQKSRDEVSMAFTASQSAMDRQTSITLAGLGNQSVMDQMDANAQSQIFSQLGTLGINILNKAT